jgi:hypothetical protein
MFFIRCAPIDLLPVSCFLFCFLFSLEAIQWKVNGDPSVFPKYESELDEHGDGGDRPVARNMTREDLLYASVYRTQACLACFLARRVRSLLLVRLFIN